MCEEGAKFIYGAEDGGATAALYPGKPLWMYVRDGWHVENLRNFFTDCARSISYDVANAANGGLNGLITKTWVAEICRGICPNPVVDSWETASLYLDKFIYYRDTHKQLHLASRLVFPNMQDVPVISGWIKEFYREALSIDLSGEAKGDVSVEFGAEPEMKPEKKIAKALIGKKMLYCLEVGGIDLTAMAMSVPVSEMGRLNLIYTPPCYRGQGYGREITASLAARLQKGGKLPVLYVRVKNKAAMKLYQSLGFLEAGRLTELKF